MLATAQGRLAALQPLKWKNEACATVVMASPGYPGEYAKGKVISGLDQAAADGRVVFHAGTKFDAGSRQWKTTGGRVLSVSGLGVGFKEALEEAYAGVDKISFEGAQWRRDIGHRALARLKI
jgi:phosphoribosylamine--glycine ligase